MAHQTVAEGIDAPHALAVELEDVAVFGILVDAIDIVDGIGILGGGVEEVAAEAQIALVVAQLAEDGGQDVDLLGHSGWAHAGAYLARGIIDDDGRRETTDCRLVLGVVRLVGMVGGEDEDRVLEPRLLRGRGEEAADGMVGVADALVDGEPLLLIDRLVLLGNDEGVVA